MSLSARDKKIVMLILPVALILGFWFLVVSPKRQEASDAQAALSKQEERRDAAVAKSGTLATAQSSFASDYAAMVRLGKAIPPTLDVPSLIVQLDRASRGTGIDFASIRAGDREGDGASSGGAPPSSGSSSSSSSSSSSAGAAPGGAPAATGAGKAAEGAGNAASSSSSGSSSSGAAPAGAGSGTPSSGGSSSTGTSASGLDEVPLEFEFYASYFELADFLHRMKRFVYVANERVRVRGRLMTIDSITYKPEGAKKLKAEVKATVYLSPKPEGATAGATPEGPAGTAPGATPQTASSSSSTPPTAAVSP